MKYLVLHYQTLSLKKLIHCIEKWILNNFNDRFNEQKKHCKSSRVWDSLVYGKNKGGRRLDFLDSVEFYLLIKKYFYMTCWDLFKTLLGTERLKSVDKKRSKTWFCLKKMPNIRFLNRTGQCDGFQNIRISFCCIFIGFIIAIYV